MAFDHFRHLLTVQRIRKSASVAVASATLLLVLSSCSREGTSGHDEGVIEFHTTALDESHPLYGFAPDNATFKFKGEKFALEMSTMGMFNMAIIGDNKLKTMSQSVKFMNIKQAAIENEKDLQEQNKDYQLKLEETGETKEMLGFKCHRVKATKLYDPNVTFDAWYTTELGLPDCNSLTPYSEIKGMLLDYRIKKFGMEMHFVARSYKPEKINEKDFEIPPSMKIVSKEEMAEFFNTLMP